MNQFEVVRSVSTALSVTKSVVMIIVIFAIVSRCDALRLCKFSWHDTAFIGSTGPFSTTAV